MLKKLKQPKNILIAILLFTFITRVFRIDFPNKYVFDEVYHAFTAKEYLRNNKEAWEWWTKPPPGVAYEWTHPPLAKEIMAGSMFIFRTEDAWAYRLPGVVLGTLCVYLLYLLGKSLFKSERTGLLAAFLLSIDGLTFVQSRTGMNDIYFIAFALISFLFFSRKKFFVSAVFFGLALASKWTTFYLFGMYFILLIRYGYFKKTWYFILIPIIIYLISYLPFFLLGHNFETFISLQQQMWWYHTHLKATHDYASPWWSWPFNLYPIWYFVDYQGKNMANIFASGNPIVFWSGFTVVILTSYELIKKILLRLKNITAKDEFFESKFICLLGYFIFFAPWAFSPRIMFLYHYSPSVPFMCLLLGHQLNSFNNRKNRYLLIILLIFMFEFFLLLYPFLTAIPMPHDMVKLFFLTNITKNPF